MNKPKDILSPDAPFIQTGRDVVNRADSIVGNTGPVSYTHLDVYTRQLLVR